MVVGLLALLSYHMGSLFLFFCVTYVLYLNNMKIQEAVYLLSFPSYLCYNENALCIPKKKKYLQMRGIINEKDIYDRRLRFSGRHRR